jgi:DNA primase
VERILPLLVPDQSVRVAFLPAGEDPDSLIRVRGAGAFGAVLAQARPLSDVLWEMETAGRSFETPESKAGLKAALNARVDQIADRSVQGFYRGEVNRRISEAFWSRPQRSASGYGGGTAPRPPFRPARPGAPRSRPMPATATGAQQTPQRPKSAALRWQRVLLATLINHPRLLDDYHEILAMTEMLEPGFEGLREALVACSGDTVSDSTALRALLVSKGCGPLLDDLLSEATYIHARFASAGVDTESARLGLSDGYSNLCKVKITRELQEAGRRLGQEITSQNFSRVVTLRSELETPLTGLDEQE